MVCCLIRHGVAKSNVLGFGVEQVTIRDSSADFIVLIVNSL